ncbi:MAG: hypothetical protein MJZ54_01840 [Bacteroidaceae bacterium]|nr:hypothetical protein [Bacteroidaceae bacterium]
MKEKIKNDYKELIALYNCYMELHNSALQHEVSICGKMALYERMRVILDSNEVFPIIMAGAPNALEDYIHNVKEDTPVFIEKIRQWLEQS